LNLKRAAPKHGSHLPKSIRASGDIPIFVDLDAQANADAAPSSH
jgi:hypothetical protein